jgi:UDP-N-acetylglucosamine 2-epimerase (non-hydrolysing)
MAPVIQACAAARVECAVCVTAQHRDMLDQMLEVFGILPDYDLNVMQENQSPLTVAARVMESLPKVITTSKPDWLLVQGDTTSAFAAAFVAYHQRVRLGHVEAGLRTQDKWQPFPEEMNRRLISVLADMNFAPTNSAAKSLRAEGVPDQKILVTGNTVIDALHTILQRAPCYSDAKLQSLNGRIVLVTAHRRENFGPPLEQICLAIRDLLQEFPDVTAVFPVHPNPAVGETVLRVLAKKPRVLLTPPLAYPEFVHLMKRAALVLSDSGGVQEEAPGVGTRVLVMRDVTERPEAVESGWARLVGASRKEIVVRASEWLQPEATNLRRPGLNPFGDGKAGERIVRALLQHFPRSNF